MLRLPNLWGNAMETYLLDWANLLLRWAHMIVGIGWIGTSFYFVALDYSLNQKERKSPGVPSSLLSMSRPSWPAI